MVVTQLPKRTTLKMGEKLIQGDFPIVAYRRRREELIEAVAAAAGGRADKCKRQGAQALHWHACHDLID